MSPAAVRKLLPRQERAAAILDAAAPAFADGGYSVTSMDELATAAGVTKIILYRHFDSKADLYRAVLDRAAGRLAGEFVREVTAADPRGSAARALITAARQDPDAFRLLWRHAPREPEFAAHADEVRYAAVQAAEGLIAGRIADPAVRGWASATVVGFLVEATLNWIDAGITGRDEEFVRRATDGVEAVLGQWGEAPSASLSAAKGASRSGRAGSAPAPARRRAHQA